MRKSALSIWLLAAAMFMASKLDFLPTFAVMQRTTVRPRIDSTAKSEAERSPRDDSIEISTEMTGGGSSLPVKQGQKKESWASCFVDSEQSNGRVLESWLLRKSAQDVFVEWRRLASETASIQCIEASEEERKNAVCLECATPVASLEALLSGFESSHASPCSINSDREYGFCKSGSVNLA